jgi:uncharacterized protein (TIGR03067 family)
MRCTIALLLLGAAGFLFTQADVRADVDKSLSNEVGDDAELERIQGVWILSSVELDGRILPGPVGKEEIVISRDGKVIAKTPTGERSGTFKLGTGKNPKTMDLALSKDKMKEVWSILYEIEGDKMRWGFSSEWEKGKRPTSFKDGKLILMQWKRQKS